MQDWRSDEIIIQAILCNNESNVTVMCLPFSFTIQYF